MGAMSVRTYVPRIRTNGKKMRILLIFLMLHNISHSKVYEKWTKKLSLK